MLLGWLCEALGTLRAHLGRRVVPLAAEKDGRILNRVTTTLRKFWKIFCIEELVFRTSTKNMNFIIFDGLQKCVEFMTKLLVSKLSVSRIRFFYIFCSCWTPGGISIGIKLVLFAMGMRSNVFGSAQDLTITSASNAFSSMPWWIEKQL